MVIEVFGVPVQELDKDDIALDVGVLVKVMDRETGDINFVHRFSDGMSPWEAVGILTSASDVIRQDILESYGDG